MKYLLRGPVDESLLKMFDAMESDTDKYIVLDIYSPGGDMGVLAYGINVIQRLRRKKKKIITVNSGVACSAGATLLVLGDEIYLGDCTLTLFHESVFLTWSGAVLDKVDRVWNWLRGRHTADANDMLNYICGAYEPWKYIVAKFGDKKIKGDYMFTSQEMEDLLDNVRVEDLPAKYDNLQTWVPPSRMDDDEMIIGEIPADVAEAIQEAVEQAEGEG